MTAPFSEQGEAAVCARVAVAYLKLIRKQYGDHEVKPLILIGITVGTLKGLRFQSLRSCLLSLSVWVGEGRQSKDWLTGVIYRDMMGFTIRRCLSESYKAHRATPLLANRGVRAATLASRRDGSIDDQALMTQVFHDD